MGWEPILVLLLCGKAWGDCLHSWDSLFSLMSHRFLRGKQRNTFFFLRLPYPPHGVLVHTHRGFRERHHPV